MEQVKPISRTEARQARCPSCDAAPGERCTGPRGRPREANHRERVDQAVADRERRERQARPRYVARNERGPNE